jgi:hypothetical protein
MQLFIIKGNRGKLICTNRLQHPDHNFDLTLARSIYKSHYGEKAEIKSFSPAIINHLGVIEA